MNTVTRKPVPENLGRNLAKNLAKNICIVGAGAIGGFVGAKLAQAGHNVSLIVRGAHLAAIQRDGLRLIHAGAEPGTAQVIRNLLENAMRYGGAGAAQAPADAVVLALARPGGQVLLSVCDRGPGVPAAYRERIFEPFFRLPGASERVGGVGLGLSLVKSIAERHGAQVRCTERAGGGACFELRGFQTPQV